MSQPGQIIHHAWNSMMARPAAMAAILISTVPFVLMLQVTPMHIELRHDGFSAALRASGRTASIHGYQQHIAGHCESLSAAKSCDKLSDVFRQAGSIYQQRLSNTGSSADPCNKQLPVRPPPPPTPMHVKQRQRFCCSLWH